MKFKFNKFKAFTLSELMIMLSVLTVLLAAFAPVFTVRYNNATSSEIWNEVPDDEERDVYTDQTNKTISAQAFIGITPSSATDVLNAIKYKDVNNNNHILYSKVVIRPSESLTGVSDRVQKQIQFRFDGTPVGALFAGNDNMLLGGNYQNILTSAIGNTSFGIGTLNSIQNGTGNTALGYNALYSLTSANYNTAIGYSAGFGGSVGNTSTGARPIPAINSGSNGSNPTTYGNTLIGYNSFTGGSSSYTTVVGNTEAKDNQVYSRGSYSTVVGNNSAPNIGNHNVVVGDYSLTKGTSSSTGNTAVGYMALTGDKVGSYNTAVGYSACSGVTGSKKTCIGYASGSDTHSTSEHEAKNKFLFTDDEERVFIGSRLGSGYSEDSMGGPAVLEVHNVNSKHSMVPLGSMGDSSVLINGNLIVRGQTYMTVNESVRDSHPNSLVGFFLVKGKGMRDSYTFSGWDGRERDVEVYEGCRGCRRHAYSFGKSNCTCVMESKYSYDWTTHGDGKTNIQNNGCSVDYGTAYTDANTGWKYAGSHDNFNEAHRSAANSCCPYLVSDMRLKNIGASFSAGLNEIKRLNVYNYTYKSDDTKAPHVGVIAQDLKRVFPTAVTKDDNGYYQIRWDEMFYAAINAVKTLNTKVESLANRVITDQKRIATLKKDNAQLEQKLNSLSVELTELEKKH